jgi:hypothetical protein
MESNNSPAKMPFPSTNLAAQRRSLGHEIQHLLFLRFPETRIHEPALPAAPASSSHA